MDIVSMIEVIQSDNIEKVYSLCRKGLAKHTVVYNTAIMNKNVKILALLDEYRYPISPSFMNLVLKTDDVKILKYFIDMGYQLLIQDIEKIIKYDSLNLFKYYYERKVRDQRAMKIACLENNVRVIEYLINTKESMSFSAYLAIIRKKRYAILKLILDAGYAFNIAVLKEAILSVDINMIKMLHDHRALNEDMLSVAIEANNFVVFKYLHGHGYLHSKQINNPARLFRDADSDIKRYAHNNNIPCNWDCASCDYCMENKSSLIKEISEEDYLAWLSERIVDELI